MFQLQRFGYQAHISKSVTLFFLCIDKKRHRSAQVLPFMNYKWKYYNWSPNMKWFHRPPQGASIKYNTKEDLYTAFPVIRKIIRPKGVHKVRIQ